VLVHIIQLMPLLAMIFTEERSMLVLTRRVGEILYIGNDIVVKVAEVNGQRVRLAIEAPDHVRINRKEIHDRLANALVGAGAHEER